MMTIIRSDERFLADHGWLRSRFSFSFAEYQDPNNISFGHLRVLNDDVIQPSEGFGLHPHRDMEIVTYVIEGTLEHKDSLGNVGTIQAGEVQRMTAGTGIYHSEYNHSAEKPVHLLQLWIFPNAKGLSPSWQQRKFSLEEQRGRLLPVVSGQEGDSQEQTLTMNQDATIYLSTLDAGQTVTHRQAEDRRVHLFVIRGAIRLASGEELTVGDAARISETPELELSSLQDGSQFMLIDLA